MWKQMNRRELLSNTTLAGVGVWLSSGPKTRADCQSPNEKLNIAIIGAGGRGASNLAGVAGENIVALCDVDERRAGSSFAKYASVRKFHDYRKMLDDMDKQIDAVVVSAPNHIHAPASVRAMRMGKHCYCEKPLAHSISEARLAAQVAAEQGVATQMGTQIHASDNFRRVVELVRSGAIGATREVHIHLSGGPTADARPRETPPIPPGLHWDLWLGPAPYRPYHPCYVPHDWHYWWDFGGGLLGNMGCHYLDLPYWALDLRYPSTIETKGSPLHPECTPHELTIDWEFPARGAQPPVTVTSHGDSRPQFWKEHELPDWAWCAFVGTKGMLLANYDQHMLWPASRFADARRPEPTIPASIGHHNEWIAACKTGRPTTCNFDYAGALTETVLLGNVAFRCGRKIQWDAANLQATNVPEANQYLQREYRKGWTL